MVETTEEEKGGTTLADVLFNDLLSYYRFQDAKTTTPYRVVGRRCDSETGEISLVRRIEPIPFSPPLNFPREDIVYLKDHYRDLAEEIPLGHPQPCTPGT